MKNIIKFTFTATAAALLLAGQSAQAATITWQTSIDLFSGGNNELFVNNTGSTAVAYNNTTDTTSGDTNVTLNGVAFTPQNTGIALVGGGGESITINGGTDNLDAFGDGQFSGNGDIFHLLRGATFDVTSFTLGGLQNGQEYLIQVFTNDARGSRDSRFLTGFDDGNGSATQDGTSRLSNSVPMSGTGSAGDSIIGTFTADSASMTVNVYGSNNTGASWATGNSQSQINGVQLRAVPEPGSAALLLGGVGMLALMRRRRK